MNSFAPNIDNDKIVPLLKWAGGKRWLTGIPELTPIKDSTTYYEPFFGGGAVFFYYLPKNAVLTDVNEELINLYIQVRDRPDDIQTELERHHVLHSKEHYYEERSCQHTDKLRQAARTLYLNRTCFNGLYRVNLKGEFNVPIGTKSSVILPTDNFAKASKALQAAEIYCADFSTALNSVKNGSFVFADPPYTVMHNNNGFLKYNDKIFSWEDQVRLRVVLESCVNRGAKIVLSNADHSSIRELYKGMGVMRTVIRKSIMSGIAANRKLTTEILLCAQ